jgi:release factor glutamine methyltransferase
MRSRPRSVAGASRPRPPKPEEVAPISVRATAQAREAIAAAIDALAAAGVETPRLDAELLLTEAIGRDRARLAAEPEAPVEPSQARAFGEMVRRRVRREPVAYILGRKGFRNLELAVDRRALIPRPETELLVEVAVEHRPRTVLDVGTGCGAVALALAEELPGAEVMATDTSTAALELARDNARRLGLAMRTRFGSGTVPPGESFDFVVANLPYVREDEWDSLAPEITEYEPREALIGGPDGLDAIRRLLADPPHCEVIAIEVGMGQGPTVAGLMAEAGFPKAETRHDLAGIERVVLGSRQ